LSFINQDLFGQADPYVTFQVDSGRKQTSSKKKGGAKGVVYYNEEFVFRNVNSASTLYVTVWDKDFISDDKIGKGKIALNQVASSGTQDVTMQIKRFLGKFKLTTS
jgi:hypothetical protein